MSQPCLELILPPGEHLMGGERGGDCSPRLESINSFDRLRGHEHDVRIGTVAPCAKGHSMSITATWNWRGRLLALTRPAIDLRTPARGGLGRPLSERSPR